MPGYPISYTYLKTKKKLGLLLNSKSSVHRAGPTKQLFRCPEFMTNIVVQNDLHRKIFTGVPRICVNNNVENPISEMNRIFLFFFFD